MQKEAAPHAAPPSEREPGAGLLLMRRDAVALGLALSALLVAWALGTRRYAMDASFWESEAFIAWSLLHLSPFELFGELLTPHSFPRAYLFAISCLKGLLGYETWVLRALPWLAFMAAMTLFVRGLYQRFGREPLLLAIGLVLLLATPEPFAVGSRLKQYSLEMAVALLVLAVSDASLDRRLRDGRSRAALLLLPLPILFSYTYAIAFAARLGAWWLARGMRGEWRIDVRSTAVVGASTVTAVGLLWWTDLRHTADTDAVFRFWSKCIVARDLSNAPALFARLLTGWWTETSPWGSNAYLLGSVGHIGLLTAITLGAVAVVRSAFGRGRSGADPEGAATFGSRALANALVPIGLFAVAWVASYPLCANRLTVFALYPISMLALEGIGLVAERLSRVRGGAVAAPLLLGAILVAIAPAVFYNAAHQWTEPPPGDIRPFVAFLEDQTELPILVGACSTAQVKTLPEWQGRDDILYYHEAIMPSRKGSFPELDRFILLSAGTHFLCPWFFVRLDEAGFRMRPMEPRGRGTGIFLVEEKREPRDEKRPRRRGAEATTPEPTD